MPDSITINFTCNPYSKHLFGGYIISKEGKVKQNGCIGKFTVFIGLEGGLDEEGKPKDTRTPQQNESLYQLLCLLFVKYDIEPDKLELIGDGTRKEFTQYNILKELGDWLSYDILSDYNIKNKQK